MLIVRQYFPGSIWRKKGDWDLTSELYSANNIGCCRHCIPILYFLLRQWDMYFVAAFLISKC